MTGYSLAWLPAAEDELADLWVAAPDRQAVTAAQAAIDRMLARDPLGLGTAVAEGLLKITVDPLTAYYEVDAARRHVTVSKVVRSS